mgnify:CR=1 FL=1
MTQSSQHQPTRRQFIGRLAATSAAVAGSVAAARWLHDPAGKAGLRQPPPLKLKNYFAGIDYGPSEPRLSIARGDDVQAMVQAALEPMGGIGRFVRIGDVVLLKPNVAFDRAPAMGATTSPALVAAVTRLCRQAVAKKVIVADNPIESPESCFAKSGVAQAALEAGATVMLPAVSQFRELAIRDARPDPDAGEALGTWPIFWPPLAQADKVINLPAIKDHNLDRKSVV